jgi:hypothetical protein
MYCVPVSETALIEQVNTENNRIRKFYIIKHLIRDSNGLTILFITLTNLEDTKTVFDHQIYCWLTFVHKWKVCAILPMTEMRILIKVTMIEII